MGPSFLTTNRQYNVCVLPASVTPSESISISLRDRVLLFADRGLIVTVALHGS